MSLKESWELEKQQRQQAVVERQQTVQHLLSEMGQARQLKAAALQSDLDTFVSTLKIQTVELLSSNAADRVLIAQQVEAMRSDVQSYLYELETQRQQQAKQLWQDLQASRAEREIEVQQLFNHFLEFRAELRNFHQTLHDYVWGTEMTESASVAALSAPQATNPANAVIKSNHPNPEAIKKNGAKTSHPSPASTQKSSLPKGSTKSSPNRSAIPTQSVAAAKSGTPTKTVTKLPVEPAQTDTATEVDHEKAVYTFLHESQGARLTQIEAALNLNRFQTVDALRSLIKKGLITQHDRVYQLQESM